MSEAGSILVDEIWARWWISGCYWLICWQNKHCFLFINNK